MKKLDFSLRNYFLNNAFMIIKCMCRFQVLIMGKYLLLTAQTTTLDTVKITTLMTSERGTGTYWECYSMKGTALCISRFYGFYTQSRPQHVTWRLNPVIKPESSLLNWKIEMRRTTIAGKGEEYWTREPKEASTTFWVRCAELSGSVGSDSATPGTAACRLLCPWGFSSQHTGTGCHALLRGSSQPRDQARSPAVQADSLPLSHQGSPHLCLNFPNHGLALSCTSMVQTLRLKHTWPAGIRKDAQRHWSSEKYKPKPQWAITSHLSEWSSSSMPQVNVGQH